MIRKYEEDTSGKVWWCNTHNRFATYTRTWDNGTKEHCCKPGQGGIMIPCNCVDLTDILEVTEDDK